MQHKLRLSFLCLPFLAGCSYLFPSHDQKNFKVDAPPKESVTQQENAEKKHTLNNEKQTNNSASKPISPSQDAPKAEPEKVISGNQPLHHISPISSPDPTAMEGNDNATIGANKTLNMPSERDDYAPALSARQQERQAAIKLRDSLERIQSGRSNNSEEDRQLSELPSSQRKAMLEQLKQALAMK